jgi:DMSO/TMAO reductase YedYZ molybdopterin-dependent catalytic subunit
VFVSEPLVCSCEARSVPRPLGDGDFTLYGTELGKKIKLMKGTEASESPRRNPETQTFAGLIVRERNPENLEFPFSALNSFVTSKEEFFVRSHFGVPKLDLDAWRLAIEGCVKEPYEIGYDELLRMPARSVTMTLECAGNSRIFLSPKVGGLQWELGAVSTAEWTGVPLAAVLKRAGVKAGATEVVLEGADSGAITKEPVSPGKIHYARSLPLAKALMPEVILAYKMNNEPLPLSHGFPLRAVVPGWYGMASVKWLTRVVVTDTTFRGYFQTSDYSFWEQRDELPIQLLPVTEIEVKAEIARPALHEIIPTDTIYRVYGAAWTGESEVSQVDMSTNGGDHWEPTQLLGESVPYAWRFWEFYWRTPAQPGIHTLMARATDARGNVQPMQRDAHRGSYMISHVQPIEVEVRKLPSSSSTDSYAI